MAKRANGDGSIINKGRNKWEVQLSFGKNPVTGKTERISKTVCGNKADAKKVLEELRMQRSNGLSFDSSKVKFGEYLDKWLSKRERQGLAASTLDDDRRICQVLKKKLGSVKLQDVDLYMVDELYRTLEDERGISPRRLRKYHVILNMVMESAIDYDLIVKNPCRRAKLPKADPVDRRALEPFEFGLLTKAVADDWQTEIEAFRAKENRQIERGNDGKRHFVVALSRFSHLAAVQIGLATGMRLGEVYGLEWGDIDFEKMELSVSRTLGIDGETKPPKTKAGIRTLSVDPVTISMLRELKGIQTAALSTIEIDVTDESPVLCSNTGGWANRHNHQRWWKEWKESHFPNLADLKFHELRHTQATRLLAAGTDIKTVQARLGHSSASVTLDFYAHASRDNDKKAAALISSMMEQSDGQPVDGKGGESIAV